MPDIQDAITGQDDLHRKRKREKRLAEQEIKDLPDWIFWNKAQMDTHIDSISNLAEAKIVLKALGHFVRIIVRLLEKYEERD